MSALTYSVQRFRGGYALVYRDEEGQRHRRKLDSSDLQSAKAEAQYLWQEANESPWTIGRIVEGYVADLAQDDPPSLPRRKSAWKALQSFWQGVEPKRICPAMCRDYRKTRKVSDATARYELLMISTALNWAVDKGHIEQRPKMWLPPKTAHKIRHLDKADFETFFAEVRAPHVRLYVLLGLFTMARPTALLELKWGQVDFARRQIDLNPVGRQQTAKKRPVVSVNDELMEHLITAFKARQCDTVVEHCGRPIQSVKKAFLGASERSGIKATPYTLRHTGAVWAAEAGVSMAELAQFMGHDDDRTTQRHYARFSPDYLRSVAKSISRNRN